jgi:hypothetical protein
MFVRCEMPTALESRPESHSVFARLLSIRPTHRQWASAQTWQSLRLRRAMNRAHEHRAGQGTEHDIER